MSKQRQKKPRSKFKQAMMKNPMVRNMAKNPMAEVIGWGTWVIIAIIIIYLIISFIRR